jgi:16S rRNA (uracil1498-N3)-methyltransferase
VLRLTAGDHVRVFNGRGAEFEAVVDAVSRDGVHLQIGAPCAAAPEPRVAITLAQAVLKGDKMDDVVRDAVMIGVAAIQPLVTARSEIAIASLTSSRKRERWARIAVSSAKQCGRAVVPPILEPALFSRYVQPTPDATGPATVLVLVEPGVSSGTALGDLDVEMPTRATLLIGPEGGWTPEEVTALSTLGPLVTLGKRTLRADAMALVALSALFARWREF